MIVPAIQAVAAIAADPTATPPVLAVPVVAAVPEQTIFGLHYNMLKTYSAENINMALLNALITWGNNLFTSKMPQIIREMTIANGLAMTPSNLKPSKLDGENLQMACMHSKFLAHQLSRNSTLGLAQTEKTKKWTNLTFLLLWSFAFSLITRSTCILKSKRLGKRILSSMRTTLSYSLTAFAITSFTLIKRTHWHTLMINSSVKFSSSLKVNSFCLHFGWNLSMQK
jgi:hypothetical protein